MLSQGAILSIIKFILFSNIMATTPEQGAENTKKNIIF